MDQLRKRIAVAMGRIAPDLVLKGGTIINVFSGDMTTADIAISDGIIAGIGNYEGQASLNAAGRYIAPGFIDGHFHIESSMLTPNELAKGLIARGTTAVIADPHEIANVLGANGIQYLLDLSEDLPVDFFFMLPSCVPATEMESAGARLSATDLLPFAGHKRVLGLAEVMNYPGVLSGDPDALSKLEAFCPMIKDGHSPLLTGKALNAYITSGIRSDHECTSLDEALEKIRLGMHIFIREGTQAKNLDALLPLVNPATARHCSFVTDDLHPHDLLTKGHLNYIIDQAVSKGLDPTPAIMMVTQSTASYFRLHTLGAVAPGYAADMVVLSSLQPIRVETVIKRGHVVFSDGRYCPEFFQPGSRGPIKPDSLAYPAAGSGEWARCRIRAMQVKPFEADSLIIPALGSTIRAIGLIHDQLLTTQEIVSAPISEGQIVSDTRRDLIKIAVVERHHATGNIGIGLVRGFGLRNGALASSVAHDSHNLICIGCNDPDMMLALKCIEEMGGGLAAACNGRIIETLPLPVAGLISDRSLEETARQWESMRLAARELGCSLSEPFMALSFLALPVIPELKITDRGLFNVREFRHVSLFAD